MKTPPGTARPWSLCKWLAPCLLMMCGASVTSAQEKGTLDPKPLPPIQHPERASVPARELFGRATGPAPLAARSIGSYARGCMAGAAALPVDGETWQVMRLSRNRNWGHPKLIAVLERLAKAMPKINGWPGLLVGDIAQPRGGPMLTGHASHQIGLDADVWLTPMPDRRLTPAEREEMSAVDMVRPDRLDIDPSVWTPQHTALIKAASQQPEVARIFVNAAIKKALCREAGTDRGWLSKVRPMFGHNYHFHIRISCAAVGEKCADQSPPPKGDGCGAELKPWFAPAILHPRPGPPRPHNMPMARLPAECRRVLLAK